MALRRNSLAFYLLTIIFAAFIRGGMVYKSLPFLATQLISDEVRP